MAAALSTVSLQEAEGLTLVAEARAAGQVPGATWHMLPPRGDLVQLVQGGLPGGVGSHPARGHGTLLDWARYQDGPSMATDHRGADFALSACIRGSTSPRTREADLLPPG